MHTPTPYKFEYKDWKGKPSIHAHISGNEYEHTEEDEDGNETGDVTMISTSVAIVLGNESSEPVTRDTAEFICRACNSYESLKAACETLLAYDRETSPPAERELLSQAVGQARAALKLCEVQQ